MRSRSLDDVARSIFGPDDHESVRRWVEYWTQSEERNRHLLASFGCLALLDFRDKLVLDIGCGTGGLGRLIGETCRLYVGGDYHDHVLQFATPDQRKQYVQCDGVHLPFSEGRFDYIFAFDVMEHLVGGKPWQVQFMRELRRVLRPLGMIFLTTPNLWNPYEGHSRLYFPQYLPTAWSDRYIAWRNPGFLLEHKTFAEIRMLTPSRLRECLRKSRLTFLHELPCGLDRDEYRQHFRLSGWMPYVGLGWYPHAEFWGILVREESRRALRLKLRKSWYYELNQPWSGELIDFGPRIDFREASFGHQLGSGWHWYEGLENGRWMAREAKCYLESRQGVRSVRLTGFCPAENHVEIWIGVPFGKMLRVGERVLSANSKFELRYLVPFDKKPPGLWEIQIRCARTSATDNPSDRRELGLMLFSIEIQ